MTIPDAPVARLATIGPDGRPVLVPICYASERDTLYWVVDAKPKSTTALKRLDNIRRDPRVSVLIDHYEDDWTKLWWVRLDGTARIVDDDEERRDAEKRLADKYPQQRPDGQLCAVDVTRVRRWDAAGPNATRPS